MAREEIIKKLDKFLAEHDPLTEECQVVYLMIEIRKILDHEKDHRRRGQFTLLRFYCDWTVHTEKAIITDNIKEIMHIVFQDVRSQITSPAMAEAMSPVMQFTNMDRLGNEMQKFLNERGMNTTLIDRVWLQFVQLLVRVLENQPIVSPTEEIQLFSFLPTAKGSVRGIVKFSHPINGYGHYTFGNSFI